MRPIYRIIYLWQGQRHWGHADYTQDELSKAKWELSNYRAMGYNAWIEQIQ